MWRLTNNWLPVAIWMGLMFYVSNQSHLPVVGEPPLQYLLSKAAHVTEYAILAALLFRAWQESLSSASRSILPFLLAFVVALLFAASDELHQSFIANRHPSVVDVAIDSVGMILGLGAVKAVVDGLTGRSPSSSERADET